MESKNKIPNENDFSIFTLKSISERQENKIFNYQKLHRTKNYKIFITTVGFGQHSVDFEKYDFSPGVFIFISKNQIQSFDFKPGNEGFIISFSEEYLEQTIRFNNKLSEKFVFNFHFKKPVVKVVAKEQEYFFIIIDRILQEYNKLNTSNEIIQALLNLLILNSERIKKEELSKFINSEYLEIFLEFKKTLESKFSEDRNANSYAKNIGVSYKHLNNVCKAVINKTAKQFIDDFIILEIKRCLLGSEISITKIIKYTGFKEYTNFIKYFKKHTGFSPLQFRKKYS